MKNLYIKIGVWCEQQGISRRELARRLYINHATLYQWGRREALPNIATLIQIADLMKVSIDDLIDRIPPS